MNHTEQPKKDEVGTDRSVNGIRANENVYVANTNFQFRESSVYIYIKPTMPYHRQKPKLETRSRKQNVTEYVKQKTVSCKCGPLPEVLQAKAIARN